MRRQLWLHAQTTAAAGRSGAGSRDGFDAGQQVVEVYLRSDQARSKRTFVVPMRTTFVFYALHAFAEPFPRMAPVCTENLIRVDAVMEVPKLAE
jgi:hypothetical protein